MSEHDERAMAVERENARLEVRRQEAVHALENSVQDNARLRAELEELRQQRNREAYQHGREIGRAVEAEAAIGRVRELANELDTRGMRAMDSSFCAAAGLIRRALDGGQSTT